MLLRAYCRFQVWLSRQEGATVIEYVLLAAVIVVGLLSTVKSLRDTMIAQFQSIINTLNNTNK